MFVYLCAKGFGNGDSGLGLAKSANKDIIIYCCVAPGCLQGGMQGRKAEACSGYPTPCCGAASPTIYPQGLFNSKNI